MTRKCVLAKVTDDSVYMLGAKNFVEITLPCNVSKISMFLRFMQKFKMVVNNGKRFLAKSGS